MTKRFTTQPTKCNRGTVAKYSELLSSDVDVDGVYTLYSGLHAGAVYHHTLLQQDPTVWSSDTKRLQNTRLVLQLPDSTDSARPLLVCPHPDYIKLNIPYPEVRLI
jgi:hypothetical protein